MATIIFSQSVTIADTAWQGFHLRIVIQPAALSAAPGHNLIRATFKFASGTSSGNIDSSYIDTQGSGNAFNFNGGQRQFKFGGATSFTGINGATTVQTDYIPYTVYDETVPLVVSIHFSGTTVDLLRANPSANVGAFYQLESDAQTGVTAPTGTFTDYSSISSPLISQIEMDTAQVIGGATASTYVPITVDIGTKIFVQVVATNAAGNSAPATSDATTVVVS